MYCIVRPFTRSSGKDKRMVRLVRTIASYSIADDDDHGGLGVGGSNPAPSNPTRSTSNSFTGGGREGGSEREGQRENEKQVSEGGREGGRKGGR